jgi:hypothetical protein
VRAYKREALWKKFFRVYVSVKSSTCDALNLKEEERMALVGAIKSGIEECNTEGSLSRLSICDIVVEKVLHSSPGFVVQACTLRIDQEDKISGEIIRILTERPPSFCGPWLLELGAGVEPVPVTRCPASRLDHNRGGSYRGEKETLALPAASRVQKKSKWACASKAGPPSQKADLPAEEAWAAADREWLAAAFVDVGAQGGCLVGDSGR